MRYTSWALRRRRFEQAIDTSAAHQGQLEAAYGRYLAWTGEAVVPPIGGNVHTAYAREKGNEGFRNRRLRRYWSAK